MDGALQNPNEIPTMKSLASLLLVLGATTLVACNSTDDDSAYEVQDAQTVTLDVSGMS
jgi:hypothetical protein